MLTQKLTAFIGNFVHEEEILLIDRLENLSFFRQYGGYTNTIVRIVLAQRL